MAMIYSSKSGNFEFYSFSPAYITRGYRKIPTSLISFIREERGRQYGVSI